MQDIMNKDLEHDKLHDKIRKHQSDKDRRAMIAQNRKRRHESKSINQRDKGIQHIPMKHVDIDVGMDAKLIAEIIAESLGEAEDKLINCGKCLRLIFT